MVAAKGTFVSSRGIYWWSRFPEITSEEVRNGGQRGWISQLSELFFCERRQSRSWDWSKKLPGGPVLLFVVVDGRELAEDGRSDMKQRRLLLAFFGVPIAVGGCWWVVRLPFLLAMVWRRATTLSGKWMAGFVKIVVLLEEEERRKNKGWRKKREGRRENM